MEEKIDPIVKEQVKNYMTNDINIHTAIRLAVLAGFKAGMESAREVYRSERA